ncbi:hypothetical protein ACHWQZ_G003232 [Mnemiopsis leidyi]
MEVRPKRDRGFIDTKKEMLWIEWQTLARHYTDDQLLVGEWFYDIYQKYSEPIRQYHNVEHVYQMILNMKHFYQELTYPRTVLFAIFFHDYIYDPKSKDNEDQSIKAFESCARDLELEDDLVKDVKQMINLTSSGHYTEEHEEEKPRTRDIHYFLDFDLSILGSNHVEYTLYAKKIREEYSHVEEEDYCRRRAQVMEKFLKRKYVYCTREFRQFAEENARKNVQNEVEMLRGRAEHLSTCKLKQHTCGKDEFEDKSHSNAKSNLDGQD